MPETKIHFNYEDKEVKLDFSFSIEDPDKCVDQMKRFKVLMERAIVDITDSIKKGEDR